MTYQSTSIIPDITNEAPTIMKMITLHLINVLNYCVNAHQASVNINVILHPNRLLYICEYVWLLTSHHVTTAKQNNKVHRIFLQNSTI